MRIANPPLVSGRDGVSVVVPLRNRGGARLWNCLNALKRQTSPPSEVIISDLNSDRPLRDEIREMVHGFGWTFMRVQWRDPRFNKAVAANCGIRRTTYPKVVLLDVDAVASPACLSYFLQSVTPNSMVLADHYRGRAPKEGEDLSTGWDAYAVGADIHEWTGTANGFFMGAYRSFWGKLCGVDERFIGWGAEDDHLVWKAEQLGAVVRMKERLLVHQEHDPVVGQQQAAPKNWELLVTAMREPITSRAWGDHQVVEYLSPETVVARPWAVAERRRAR